MKEFNSIDGLAKAYSEELSKDKSDSPFTIQDVKNVCFSVGARADMRHKHNIDSHVLRIHEFGYVETKLPLVLAEKSGVKLGN